MSQKPERQIFSTLWAKCVICFTSLDKASSAEENDTKIIEFDWVILILCPFVEIQSCHFEFCLIFATDEHRIVLGKAFHTPVFRLHCSFVDTDQWASPKHHMKGHSRHNSSLIGRKNQAKCEMTVFQEMGIESILLNQIEWSWYHSLLRKMLYLMMQKIWHF